MDIGITYQFLKISKVIKMDKDLKRKKGIVLYTSWRAVVIILAIITSGTIITIFAIQPDTYITNEYGLSEKNVKALMRHTLKPGSYRAWRKRVRSFGDRREHYK